METIIYSETSQVNTVFEGDQTDAKITTLSDGGYIITWVSEGADWEGSSAIHAQRYDAAGYPVGEEFRVNQIGQADQVTPDITATTDGGYVIVWNTPAQVDGLYRISAMHFRADGTRVRNEFTSNNDAYKMAADPKVTSLADGGYVVTWTSEGQDGAGAGVYMQRFDRNSQKVSYAIQIPATVENNEENLDITTLADGSLAVAWHDETGSYVQVITVDGTKLYDVALGSGVSDIAVSIDALSTGGFVASWREYDAISGQHVLYRQRFAADGVALDINAVEVARGQNIHDGDSSASVVALPDGGYFMTWASLSEAGVVLGQRVFADGMVSDVFSITENSNLAAAWSPSADLLHDGSLMVTWEGLNTTDTSSEIYSRHVDISNVSSRVDDVLLGEKEVILGGFRSGFTDRFLKLSDGRIMLLALTGHFNELGIQFFSSDFQPLESHLSLNEGISAVQESAVELPNGNIVITWHDLRFKKDVHALILDPEGNVIVPEFTVNSYTGPDSYGSSQDSPDIAVLVDGSFIIVWKSQHQDGSLGGIAAQRFSQDGSRIGGEFLVNATTYEDQVNPAVIALDNGGFMISWTTNFAYTNDPSLFMGRYYDAEGNTSGGDIYFPNVIPQNTPSFHKFDDGSFIATSNDNTGIFTMRFDKEGRFLPNTKNYVSVGNTRAGVQLEVLSDGGYLVVWEQYVAGDDFTVADLYARRYDAFGQAVGNSFLVEEDSRLYNITPDLVTLDDQTVLISWTTLDPAGGGGVEGIFTRKFFYGTEDASLMIAEQEVFDIKIDENQSIAVFSEGIQAHDLWFRQEGHDLVTQVLGSEEAVAIEGWYDQESVNYQAIDEFELADGTRLEAAQVQSLVEAMNGFAPSVIAENNVVDHEDYDQTRHVITASWGTV